MNSFAGALGQPHRRQCGIPQGCPLSMAFVALLTRPWILQMEAIGAMARVLADDILLLTKGGRALHLFHEAFNLTIIHLHDLGGKVSPAKSLVFSTVVRFRHWLRRHTWVPLAQTIAVVSHFRDLGAQLTATNRIYTAQSKACLQDGVYALHRIARLPHALDHKARFAVACANKKALYSCEANHVDESAFTTLHIMLGAHYWNTFAPSLPHLSVCFLKSGLPS